MSPERNSAWVASSEGITSTASPSMPVAETKASQTAPSNWSVCTARLLPSRSSGLWIDGSPRTVTGPTVEAAPMMVIGSSSPAPMVTGGAES